MRAKRVYRGIVGGAFDAAIPTTIVICAIAIVFAIGFVVLFVVADKIVQREAIVSGYEIDAGVRPASAASIEIA